MSQTTTNGSNDQTKVPDFTEGANLNVANPVILLVGKTGAGKSTLGNLLLAQPHDEGPFYVSADMESVTKECGSAAMSIDGVMYNVVDTPGIFDTQQVTDEILKEIAKAVQKCAYGVKAILFVFEARRFTEEQKNVLKGIRRFLGEEATNYIIAVFSHATKAQIKDRNTMRKAWNAPVRSFIQEIENRWGIAPNSDYYPPDDPIHKARLGEIRTFISAMRGVYTTEQLEKSRQEQEEARLRKEAEEKKAKQEYEEKLKESARKKSEEAHKRKLEEMEREQKARQEQEEKLRRKEREENERRLEEMRKEQKARQEYEENLRKKDRQEAEERFKQTMDLLNREREERQIQEENFRKREQEAEERRRQQEAEERRLRQEREENLRRAERQEAEEMYRRRMEEAERERSNRERQEYMELLEEMKRQQEEAEQRIREANERNKGDCFSLDTKVQLASGKFIEMAELKVGDYVCSNVSENGELEFSEVYLISHLGHYENPLKMIKIEFTNPDGQKSQIRMTSTHCIFREDLSILYAQDVMPGETKILVLNEANKLIPVIVDGLTIEEETGFVSFYTRAGTVIANNTLCSCYDDCPPLQGLMDLVFAPIRLWTKVFPSNHRQKELHPYVRTLEVAYATLCNASNIGRRLLGLS